MKTFLTFFYVSAILSVAVSKSDYCELSCLDSFQDSGISRNIGCGHSNTFDTNCPNDAKMLPVSDSVKRMIVDLHNEKRNIVAGGGNGNHDPACNITAMKWDEDLAELAALNVKKCRMEHDICYRTENFETPGQNLAQHWNMLDTVQTAEAAFKLSIEAWYKEIVHSNRNIINNFIASNGGEDYGHFTVMVADRNTHVGCAGATYSKDMRLYTLVACNYAFTNMLTEPIYVTCSNPGEKCSTGRHSTYQNLCN